MTLNSNSFDSIKIVGGEVQKEFNDFNTSLKKATYPLSSLFRLFKDAAIKKNQPLMDSLEVLMKPLRDKGDSMRKEYIASHFGSFLSLIFLDGIVQRNCEPYPVQRELFDALDSTLKKTYTGRVVEYILGFRKKTELGEMSIDFTLPDTSGKLVKLSDFRGKYVLLDFWASWCVPCRIQNPKIVEAFQKYRDKGFTVLGVSLDTDKDKWKKAIKDDRLDWTQLCDFKVFSSEPVHEYFVRSIPTSYLISPEGIIIGKNLRGDDLGKKLNEIFDSVD